MKIIETSRDFSPVELYTLTKNPKSEKLREHVGEVLEVTGFCIYEDNNSDETSRTVLTLERTEGEPIGTNSDTARRSLKQILEIYAASGIDDPYPLPLVVYTAKSAKSGREFVDLMLQH